MAQLKSNTQTKLDTKADINANNEVVQLPSGAAAEVAATRLKAVKRADGSWLEALGEGQTWQDMSSTRAFGTTYINNTGKPIMVKISGRATASSSYLVLDIDGIAVEKNGEGASNSSDFSVDGLIPDGSIYSVTATNINATSFIWAELR